tara:strand:- start:924 stop:1307 length:384 start_codon:yes stop_codon:yes gene_type:complete
MEDNYNYFLIKNKVYFGDSGILGCSKSFSSSIFSKTDCVSCKSPLDNTTKEMLDIINNVAIIAVVFVKKLPTDLVEAKLSWDNPSPSAPPSDLCSKTIIINIIASTILATIKIVSIMVIYRNFLLYQ